MPLRRNWTPNAQGAPGSSTPVVAQGAQAGPGIEVRPLPANLANLLAQHGNDPLAVAERLLRDNYDSREARRELSKQLDAYKALGAPDDVAAKLRLSELERVAGRAGLNPTVFADLDRMAGGKLAYEARVEEVDGAQVERFYVTDATDPASQPQPLEEFLGARFAPYLPALQPTVASQGQSSGAQIPAQAAQVAPAQAQATPMGLRFPVQHPGGGSSKPPDMVAKFQAEQAENAKAVKNPLLG